MPAVFSVRGTSSSEEYLENYFEKLLFLVYIILNLGTSNQNVLGSHNNVRERAMLTHAVDTKLFFYKTLLLSNFNL